MRTKIKSLVWYGKLATRLVNSSAITAIFVPQAFSIVFGKAIERAEPADDVKSRVLNLIDFITFSVFNYTSRGLFEKDKLIFVAQMCFTVSYGLICFHSYILLCNCYAPILQIFELSFLAHLNFRFSLPFLLLMHLQQPIFTNLNIH